MKIYLKFFTFSILFTVFVAYCFAYSIPQDYRGIKVKWYSDDIDREVCLNNLDYIPDKYLEDVRYIRFYDQPTTLRNGQYSIFTQIIDIYEYCSMNLIIHELAHHCQWNKGDSKNVMKEHKGSFKDCQRDIWGEVAYGKIFEAGNYSKIWAGHIKYN